MKLWTIISEALVASVIYGAAFYVPYIFFGLTGKLMGGW